MSERKPMRKGHVARRCEGNFPLESSWNNSVGGEEKMREIERKRKKIKEIRRKRGVRSFTFSLGFTEIGPSIFVEARGKIHPYDESFV